MNRVLCLAFVLLLSVGIFAQEKTPGESDFTGLYKKAMAKRENKAYRVKTTFQTTVEGKPEETNSGTTVMEFAPPEMSRVVFQSTNSKAQPTEGERIKINDKVYTRENGAAWKSGTASDDQSENKSTVTEANVNYKFIGNETLNSQPASVYEKTESRKRVSKKDGKEINSDIATRYWFSGDGDLLKTERTATVHVGDKTLHVQVTKAYEMDPSIKIEMPQVAGSVKQ